MNIAICFAEAYNIATRCRARGNSIEHYSKKQNRLYPTQIVNDKGDGYMEIKVIDKREENAAEKYRLWQAEQLMLNMVVKYADGTVKPLFVKNSDGTFSKNPSL